MNLTSEQFAKTIDHTLLRPEAVEKDIAKICEEARKYNFMSVIVNPCYVELAKSFLTSSAVKVGTVVGFPFGAATPETKAFEAHDAVLRGADEIDMVINIGALKSGNFELVQNEIKGVIDASLKKRVIVKVILETCYLDEEQKRLACRIINLAPD
ncbi:MAG: deoxyribose-phosphate aldolase [Actinobacteria bacterium]|nr:deoxyribose-phosphate aldolase [Actinomycetota bacterium]